MIQFQENTQADSRTEGLIDPISQEDPSGYHQGSDKYNCSRLPLKSQKYRAWCWSNQNYCTTVSMQKISSINKLHLKIQQFLGSHKLYDHDHFWKQLPKNHWNNFQLSWICTSMQKISSFHLFTIEIQSNLESCI